MARQWERVDEDTTMRARFGQDPPPSISAPTLAHYIPSMEARPPTLAGNLLVAEEPGRVDGS